MIHVQLKVVSEFNQDVHMRKVDRDGRNVNTFPTSGRFNPEAPISVTPSKGNLGTTRGKEKVF